MRRKELQMVVVRSAGILKCRIEMDGALEVARRSRGTPRIANRLLRRVRDFAEVKHHPVVTQQVANDALIMLNVDPKGFDQVDHKFLRCIIEKFDGGPVGLDSLAASIGEERGTIEDVIEPFLLQEGFIARTPRGRIATRLTYEHFGFKPKNLQSELSV